MMEAAAPLVLVAGSLHLDTVVKAPRLPELDETLPGHAVEHVCGGKGGNQAVAAARFGARTAFAGAVGDDEAGRTLLANLRGAGVDCAQVAVLGAAASGMSVAILTDSGEYGAVIVSGANLAIDPEAIALPFSTRVLVLQNEVPAEVNAALAARARAAGVRVLLNAAPARRGTETLLRQVDVLVVNRVEAAAMRGALLRGAGDAMAAAQKLGARGRDAIVTLGGEGAALSLAGGEARHFPGISVMVSSTHGAGDAFVGALAARLALGAAAEEALHFAQAAAALHVSLPPEARDAVTTEAVEALLKAGR